MLLWGALGQVAPSPVVNDPPEGAGRRYRKGDVHRYIASQSTEIDFQPARVEQWFSVRVLEVADDGTPTLSLVLERTRAELPGRTTDMRTPLNAIGRWGGFGVPSPISQVTKFGGSGYPTLAFYWPEADKKTDRIETDDGDRIEITVRVTREAGDTRVDADGKISRNATAGVTVRWQTLFRPDGWPIAAEVIATGQFGTIRTRLDRR